MDRAASEARSLSIERSARPGDHQAPVSWEDGHGIAGADHPFGIRLLGEPDSQRARHQARVSTKEQTGLG
jgi:hypothetical protein